MSSNDKLEQLEKPLAQAPRHPMRRSERQMSESDAWQLLRQGEYGVLSTCGQDGWPYAVPLSYALDSTDRIILHCAKEGRKLDNLRHDSRVCFTVTGKTEVLASAFSTRFESVLAFGFAQELFKADEKREALRCLVEKYSPGFEEEGQAYAERALEALKIFAISIQELTGKERK